jgi:CDGSH-type Zn-finger protein
LRQVSYGHQLGQVSYGHPTAMQAASRANHYGVASNMPPSGPVKRVDMLDLEELAAKVASDGKVALCRCYKSSTFPHCDGAHGAHNEATGDNSGPVVLTSGLPAEKRGLNFTSDISEQEKSKACSGPRANNYGIASNMPPNDPVKRVDMIDIEDVKEAAANGPVALCRCYKSASFPLCDGSHGGHNEACGDNTGPVVIKKM